MRDRLLIAKKQGDEEKEKAIKQIITNERTKDDWRRIKFGIGKPVASATTKIQKVIDGEIVDITEPEVMNREIQESSKNRFSLAYSARIQQTSLKDKLGTCSERTFARHLLEG